MDIENVFLQAQPSAATMNEAAAAAAAATTTIE
jgi:hypothetical protein